jgi:gliding motility-associated-like protein
MPYTATGNPSVYSITWSAAAIAAGFNNISNAALGASPLALGVPAGIAAGTYSGSIVATNTTNNQNSLPQTVTINVVAPTSVSATTGKDTICVGTATTLVNATPGGTWSSANSAIADVTSGGVVTGIATGSTTIRYSVPSVCPGTPYDFRINVITAPTVQAITGPDSVEVGKTILLQNVTGGGVWRSSNSGVGTVASDGTVRGVSSGTVTIRYTLSNACDSASSTYQVKVYAIPPPPAMPEDLFIPNFFTPNGDAKNDFFSVYGTAIQSLELKVYTQWGQSVFETRDILGKWDGTYKGEQQPVGAYVYTAKVVLQNGEVVSKEGSVNLIR